MRFVINLPQEELESVERICFQVEEAQWFYEDFIRPLDPDLPSLSLRDFCLRIFQHCPLLSEFSSYHHSAAFSEFLAYKTRVPVRGAIMINQDMSEVVLVKGWKKGASWSFPRGKINKDEPDLDCAIREVYEETGFDIKEAGLVEKEEDMKYIDVTMREQHMRLYVFRGVPMDTYFEPRTRKEISKIQWYKLSELPTLKKKKQQQEGRGEDLATNATKFYMVAPFLNPLNKWIVQQRKLDKLIDQRYPNLAPILVQTTHSVVDEQTFGNDIYDHSAGDDMGRLLANLRQSGQPISMSDLPEVSEPPDIDQDTNAELNKLLSVDSQATKNTVQSSATASGVPTQLTANGNGSSALLALLRGKGATCDQVPQTPLEQTIEHPAVPRPPHHHHHHVPSQHVPPLPSPSTFPYPAIHGQQQQFHSSDAIHSSKPLLHIRDQQIELRYHSRLTTSQPLPAQQNHQLSKSTNSKPSSATAADLKRQVPAPYQRTGDPEFSRHSQYSSSLPPSIPPASKLPPPKLTTHSSALLDLFKTDQSAKSVPDTKLAKPPTAHLRVFSNVEGSHEHLEVSPLTEQSNERDLRFPMDPAEEAEQQRSKLAAWGSFQATSARQNAEERRRIAGTDAERLAEEARTGIRYEPQLPTMSETWRKVKIDHQANQRRVVSVNKPAATPQEADGTARKGSRLPISNLSELTQEFTVDEAGHPRNPPQKPQEYVQSKVTPGPRQTFPPKSPIEPKEASRSNPGHKAALLDLFRRPSVSAIQPSKSTASLEPPGPPVELSALPSPGHSRETSQAEHSAPRRQSQSTKIYPVNVQEKPRNNLKTRKSPMSATVSGPLNVPNFDAIAQKPEELKGPAENMEIEQIQEGPPLTIPSRPRSTQASSQTGQRKGPVSIEPATVMPATAVSTVGSHKDVNTTLAPFQPQILRRPSEKSLQSQATSSLSRVQPSNSSKHPTSFDRRTSQTQEHKETLLSLFGKPTSLVPATNSSSAISIGPLSEKLVSQQGKLTVVSPLTSRSRMSSLVSSTGEGTIKSGGLQSPRLPGDKKFLLNYLEGVAKERR